ncbi:hypothetical protein L209DRAFT_755977 [Thermothelomyces heterothallicus CBS 203.75]
MEKTDESWVPSRVENCLGEDDNQDPSALKRNFGTFSILLSGYLIVCFPFQD